MAEGSVHLVDDDPGVRDALAFLLRSRGLAVRTFDGGPALLETLDREAPRQGPPKGVFLLDVRMEPMTGTRLHDELIAQRPEEPGAVPDRPRRHSHGRRGAEEGRLRLP